VKLFSKNSNLCVADTWTSQTDDLLSHYRALR